MGYGRIGVPRKRYAELVIASSLLLLSLMALTYIIKMIRKYRRSWKFQAITKAPKRSIWMFKYDLANIRKTDLAHFSIYTKAFKRRIHQDKRSKTWKDSSPKVTPHIRRVLEKHFNFSIDADMIPDSTCIVSIPMKNFKSSSGVPGDFDALLGGGLDEGSYEYQMVGDDRIQVAYFVTGEERYVAGICIYIEDPYQREFEYRESIILDLLGGKTYWSKSGTENLTISKNDDELTLLTKNRYGEQTSFKYDGVARKFEVVDETETRVEPVATTKLEDLTVGLCKSENKLVNIGKNADGMRMHAVWNEMTKNVDLVECASCAEPDASPPGYPDLVDFE